MIRKWVPKLAEAISNGTRENKGDLNSYFQTNNHVYFLGLNGLYITSLKDNAEGYIKLEPAEYTILEDAFETFINTISESVVIEGLHPYANSN